MNHHFTTTLLNWYDPARRPLPWKHIDDPYLIWLSEIILQQTRVDQGLAYFEKFKKRFPKVENLAAASEDEVLKMWEGLGYYSRARNLHFAAKTIVYEFSGQFPRTYKEILSLKGVGTYTAAAIASFAYSLPHAVVDGNVYRVLSRVYDAEIPIDTTAGKKHFTQLATDLLDKNQPALYNQAIMDFGATVCTPKLPKCDMCPLNADCLAQQYGTIGERPMKSKRLHRKTRYFNFLVINGEEKILLEQRTAKDIWQQLYQFPLIESEQEIQNFGNLTAQQVWPGFLSKNVVLKHKSATYKQDLTHQRIYAIFWEIEIGKNDLKKIPTRFLPIEPQNLRKFAFPKIIDWYLNDKTLS